MSTAVTTRTQIPTGPRRAESPSRAESSSAHQTPGSSVSAKAFNENRPSFASFIPNHNRTPVDLEGLADEKHSQMKKKYFYIACIPCCPEERTYILKNGGESERIRIMIEFEALKRPILEANRDPNNLLKRKLAVHLIISVLNKNFPDQEFFRDVSSGILNGKNITKYQFEPGEYPKERLTVSVFILMLLSSAIKAKNYPNHAQALEFVEDITEEQLEKVREQFISRFKEIDEFKPLFENPSASASVNTPLLPQSSRSDNMRPPASGFDWFGCCTGASACCTAELASDASHAAASDAALGGASF